MARRYISPPPELAEAHALFKATIRSAYRAFMQAKRQLGFCMNGSCMDHAEPDRTLCKFHAAYQSRWQRKHTEDARSRVMCEAHGNYADVCGCPDPTSGVPPGGPVWGA